MQSRDKSKNEQNLNQSKSAAPQGACIITLENGNKECVVDRTQNECTDICNERPGATCDWSPENTCPRGQ